MCLLSWNRSQGRLTCKARVRRKSTEYGLEGRWLYPQLIGRLGGADQQLGPVFPRNGHGGPGRVRMSFCSEASGPRGPHAAQPRLRGRRRSRLVQPDPRRHPQGAEPEVGPSGRTNSTGAGAASLRPRATQVRQTGSEVAEAEASLQPPFSRALGAGCTASAGGRDRHAGHPRGWARLARGGARGGGGAAVPLRRSWGRGAAPRAFLRPAGGAGAALVAVVASAAASADRRHQR